MISVFSFSKSYAMSGLRVGYAVAAPAIAEGNDIAGDATNAGVDFNSVNPTFLLSPTNVTFPFRRVASMQRRWASTATRSIGN